MKYINGFLILFLIYMCYITARGIANSNRITERNRKSFWAKESEANSVRRADISNLDYIKIPMDTLPVKAAENLGCSDLISALAKLSEKKILNLSMYTNTELKLMYGPANLDTLIQCDTNYTELIKILNKIGLKLIESNAPDIAEAFLEYAISIGSDISTTYTGLGSVYKEKGKEDKLSRLIASANALTSLSKNTIITNLNNIKSSGK